MALTRGTLDGLDILVVRGATAAALGPTEGRAVDEEVRMGGLGLVVMTDDTALTAGFGMEVLARNSAGTPNKTSESPTPIRSGTACCCRSSILPLTLAS